MARSTRLVIYVYFKGSETLPSTSYIRSDESSILFYSASNGYKDHQYFKRSYSYYSNIYSLLTKINFHGKSKTMLIQ